MEYTPRLETAERSVVGAVFLDPRVYEQTGLTPSHFFDPKLKVIWEAMGSLRGKGMPVDEVTLAQALGTTLESVGGLQFLAELALEVPTADNAVHYADTVREFYTTRAVSMAASSVVELAKGGVAGEDLIRAYQSSLEGLYRTAGGRPAALDSVALERLSAALNGTIPSGLPTGLGLEKIVPGGIPRDKVTMVFADTATFKTTIKNQILTNLAMEGYSSFDVSLEDSSELTADRYLSRLSGVPYGRIHGGVLSAEEIGALAGINPEQLEVLRRVHPADGINPRISDIVRAARRLQYSGGLDAVAIDYIQLLEGPGQKEMLDEVVRTAQLAAKRDRVAYILLSQVKSEYSDRENPRPQLRDMLGSSAMRTGAKLAIGLFRPWKHWPNPQRPSADKDRSPSGMYNRFLTYDPDGALLYPNILELWVVKNVLGADVKGLHLLVDAETGNLVNYSDKIRPYLSPR